MKAPSCAGLALLAGGGMVLWAGPASGSPSGNGGHAHSFIIQAPTTVSRWEPSAAVVLDGRLWVGSDKPVRAGSDRWGVLAAYDLPLSDWKTMRSRCESNDDRAEHRCDANRPVATVLVPGMHKVEAGTPVAYGAAWWDTGAGHRDFLCVGAGQQPCVEGGLLFPPTADILRATVAESVGVDVADVKHVVVEGLTFHGGELLLGVRKYQTGLGEVYWTGILDGRGQIVWGGGELQIAGKVHAISDLASSSGSVWVTLAYEGVGDGRGDVEGRLAALTWGEAPEPQVRLCSALGAPLVFEGKPEGIALYEDSLLLVFDNDDDRKEVRRHGASRFPLRRTQDYVTVIPQPDCSDGPLLNTHHPSWDRND